jgi:SNF2 family DNA or RNA helicase
MEPGTGKTKVALDYCNHLRLKANRLRRVLVVAPLGVLSVWEDELERHFAGDYRVVRLPKGSKRGLALAELHGLREIPSRPVFLLINYELCWRVLKDLLLWKPQVVIADESHQIKHHNARKSRALHRFADLEPPPLRLILSGTPITNSPLDAYSQWRFLNPARFGTRYRSFKERYAIWGGYGGYELLSYRNLDELTKRVAADSFIIKKKDCLDLPASTDSIIRVASEPHTDKVYADMAHDLVAFITGADKPVTAPIILTKLLRLSQITGGFAKTDDGQIVDVGTEKREALRELLESLDDKPVVIFARFLWEIGQCAGVAGKLERSARIISGTQDPYSRAESVKMFRSGKVNTLICQIATGGLGIDLSVAQYAIFYSLDYSSDHYIQARDRLHRIGQENPVTYYHLIMDKTIDGMILRALRNHRKVSDLILSSPQVLIEH